MHSLAILPLTPVPLPASADAGSGFDISATTLADRSRNCRWRSHCAAKKES